MTRGQQSTCPIIGERPLILVWWNARTEVVHLLGYDYPVFKRTKRRLESERNPGISC
jgi:hypothetical protein